MFRQTFEITVRDYTMWSGKVRPYDLKAPIIDCTLCHILYTIYSRVYIILLYTIDYILYTWSIYIRWQDHSKEAIRFFTHGFGPCGSPTIAYYSIL